MQRRMTRNSIARVHLEISCCPFHEMDNVGVGDDNALRRSGRSGSEQDMRCILGGVPVVWPCRRIPADVVQGEAQSEIIPLRNWLCVQPADRNGLPDPVIRRYLIEESHDGSRCQYPLTVRGCDHLDQPAWRAGGVERHVDAVRLIDPHNAGDSGSGLRHEQADSIVPFAASELQNCRQLARKFFQPAVG